MMKKLALTLALATSFGPNTHAMQEVQAAPTEAIEQTQQEEGTLKKVWNSKERKITTGSGKIALGLGMIIAAVPHLKDKKFFIKTAWGGELNPVAKVLGTVRGFFVSPFCKDFKTRRGFERLPVKEAMDSPLNEFTFPVAAGLYLVASGSKDIYKNVASESSEQREELSSESFTHKFKKLWDSTPRKAISAGAKITGGALALAYYCVAFRNNSFLSAFQSGKMTLKAPMAELNERFTEGSSDYYCSRTYTIPAFIGSYLLGSGITDAVKLAKEIKAEAEENKEQEPEPVPAQ